MNHAQTLLYADVPPPLTQPFDQGSAASLRAACCSQLRGLPEGRLFRGVIHGSVSKPERTDSPRGNCQNNLCTHTRVHRS